MNKLFTFLFLCFFASPLFAQERSNICFEFEDLPLNKMYGQPTGYAPGDVLLEEEGISLSLAPYTTTNGTTEFFATTIEDNPFNLMRPDFSRGLFVSNINLALDFSDFAGEIVRIAFNFADGGGDENIAVNGQEIQIVERFSQLNREIAPGVELILHLDSTDQAIEHGTFVLEGEIKSLVIGGQELFIDNLCVRTAAGEPCDIRDLVIRPGECFDNEQYRAQLNFFHRGADNELFDIFLNGSLIATKALADLPVELELPYNYNAETSVLSVCINDRPDCCERIEFEQPDCDNVGDCGIELFELYPTECNEEGEYLVNVFVVAQDGSPDGYFVEDISGERWGPFSYLDSTVVIGPYSDLLTVVQEFTVIDAGDETCRARRELINPCGNNCAITRLFLEAHPCDENGQFLVDIEVRANNGSADGFYIVDVFRERFGPFSYEERFITLGPYSDLDDVPLVFTAIDAGNENCKKQEELFDVCVRCRIEEVIYEAHPCDDNGQFLLDLEVLARGGSADGFFIEYIGEQFGPFSYQDNFITIGPLSAGFDVPPELRVYDAENPNCAWYDIISPPCNSACNLRIFAETTRCNEENQFFVEVTAVGGLDTYFIEAGGRNFGPFSYADSTVRIGPFTSDREDFLVIIHDAIIPYCSDTLFLESPCFRDACGLSDIKAETTPCRDNGTFGLVLDFDSFINLDDTFALRYQDRILGYYNRNDLPIKIEDFPFDSQRFVQICTYSTRGECCSIVPFRVPCDEERCLLDRVRVASQGCDANGQFYFKIKTPASDEARGGFIVDVLGQTFGPFSYQDSAILVGPFDGNIDLPYKVSIYDIDRDECFYEETFASPCDTVFCSIEDVRIAPKECDEDGQFYVRVAVWPNNSTSESYIVDVFGEQFGPFSYLDSFAIIGPFDGNIDAPYEILIYDSENDECFYAGIFESPCNRTCEIGEVSVETSECFDDGSFNLVIDFEVEGADNEFFDVYYQEEIIGYFRIDELPVVIENFRSRGNTNARDRIQICINDNRDCCAVGAFFPPCSTSECHITEVVAEPLICENNQFKVDLFVKSEQPNYTGYFLQVNDGQLFGPFSYQQEFVTIGPFEGDGNTVYRVTVIDGEDRTCRNGTRFQAVNCSSQCNINELRIAVGEDCNEDGTFPVTIDFDIQNPVGMGYSIYADDRLLGTYPYGTVPLYLPRFNTFGRRTVTISVIAGEDRNCAMRKILEAPECSIDTSDLWPGDTDNNGIAHYTDLLNIGLAYGSEGPIRPDSTLEWYAHDAPRWRRAFMDGTNYKHADANGDGRIDEHDVEVIELNYGNLRDDLTAPPETGEDNVIATAGDPSIYVDLPEAGNFPNGSAFSVPVILGSSDNSVESVYGIAFTIKYDPNVLDPNELRLTVPDSWLGNTEEDLLIIQREYPDQGLIEVAISRKNGEAVTGYGVVALMSGIIVDVVGFSAIEVGIKKVKAIRVNSELIPIRPETRIAKITTTSINNWAESGLSIYPNPVDELLRMDNTSNKNIEQVEIINLQGKVMKQFIRPENEILLSDLPVGLYLLKVQLGDDFYHQQIIKQ